MTEVGDSFVGSCTAATAVVDCPMVNETCAENNLCLPKPCTSDTDCPSEIDSSGTLGFCLIVSPATSGTCQECQRLQPTPTCDPSNLEAECDKATDMNPVVTSNCPQTGGTQYCFTDSDPVTGSGNYCTTKDILCSTDDECETWQKCDNLGTGGCKDIACLTSDD
jgi:hypothetical protein